MVLRPVKMVVVFLIVTVACTAFVATANANEGGNVKLAEAKARLMAAQAAQAEAQAKMIIAAAEAQRALAETRKIEAEAVRMELENDLRAAELFFQKKRLNRDYRDQQVLRYRPVPRLDLSMRSTQTLNVQQQVAELAE